MLELWYCQLIDLLTRLGVGTCVQFASAFLREFDSVVPCWAGWVRGQKFGAASLAGGFGSQEVSQQMKRACSSVVAVCMLQLCPIFGMLGFGVRHTYRVILS